jgi:hypothetical protein
MPKKKLTKQELGISTLKQQDNLRGIKSLARISQAHRVIEAAYRNEHTRDDKQTQTEPEFYIEAEIVDSSESESEREVGIIAEAIPAQEEAYSLGRSFWILFGILLAIWIRLLQ